MTLGVYLRVLAVCGLSEKVDQIAADAMTAVGSRRDTTRRLGLSQEETTIKSMSCEAE